MCDPCSSSAVLRASISVYPNLDPNRFPNMALYQKVTPLAVLEFHFIHGVHLLWGRAKRRENCRLHCTALHSTVHTQMVCGSGMPKFCRRGRRRLARTTTNGRKTREGGRPDRERERERERERGGGTIFHQIHRGSRRARRARRARHGADGH